MAKKAYIKSNVKSIWKFLKVINTINSEEPKGSYWRLNTGNSKDKNYQWTRVTSTFCARDFYWTCSSKLQVDTAHMVFLVNIYFQTTSTSVFYYHRTIVFRSDNHINSITFIAIEIQWSYRAVDWPLQRHWTLGIYCICHSDVLWWLKYVVWFLISSVMKN